MAKNSASPEAYQIAFVGRFEAERFVSDLVRAEGVIPFIPYLSKAESGVSADKSARGG